MWVPARRHSFQPLMFFVCLTLPLTDCELCKTFWLACLSQRGNTARITTYADEPLPPRQDPKRIALCFFGIARSLRWTLGSIKARVIDVLQEAGLEVDIFVHTYDLHEVGKTQLGAEPRLRCLVQFVLVLNLRTRRAIMTIRFSKVTWVKSLKIFPNDLNDHLTALNNDTMTSRVFVFVILTHDQ